MCQRSGSRTQRSRVSRVIRHVLLHRTYVISACFEVLFEPFEIAPE